MKQIILASSLLLIICCTGCHQKQRQQSSTLKKVSVVGNQFMVNADTIVFQGLCLEDIGELQQNGHWNKTYVDNAAKWNINIVRFPVHPSHWRRLGKETYLSELKKGILWAKEHQLYSIIDWHIIGNLKDAKWQHPMYETNFLETLEFWSTMAKTFSNEPSVAFYELYNEPTTYNGTLGTMTWNELTSIYQQIMDTINRYDTTKVSLIAGFNWAYDLRDLHSFDPQFRNVGYVSHPYPQKSDQPWITNWEEVFGFVTEKYPVFATEFGFAYPEQKGSHIPVIGNEQYGTEILNYFRSKNISHTLWVFSWHWYPTLLKDSTYTLEKGQGEFFYKEFENFRIRKMEKSKD